MKRLWTRSTLSAEESSELSRLASAVDTAKAALLGYRVLLSWKRDKEEYEDKGHNGHEEEGKAAMRAMFAMLVGSQLVYSKSEGRMVNAVVRLPSSDKSTDSAAASSSSSASAVAIDSSSSSSSSSSKSSVDPIHRYLHVSWSFNDDPYDHQTECADFDVMAFITSEEAIASANGRESISQWGINYGRVKQSPTSLQLFSFDYTRSPHDRAPTVEPNRLKPLLPWLAARGVITLPPAATVDAQSSVTPSVAPKPNPLGLSIGRYFLLYMFNAIAEGMDDFSRCTWEERLFCNRYDADDDLLHSQYAHWRAQQPWPAPSTIPFPFPIAPPSASVPGLSSVASAADLNPQISLPSFPSVMLFPKP